MPIKQTKKKYLKPTLFVEELLEEDGMMQTSKDQVVETEDEKTNTDYDPSDENGRDEAKSTFSDLWFDSGLEDKYNFE